MAGRAPHVGLADCAAALTTINVSGCQSTEKNLNDAAAGHSWKLIRGAPVSASVNGTLWPREPCGAPRVVKCIQQNCALPNTQEGLKS